MAVVAVSPHPFPKHSGDRPGSIPPISLPGLARSRAEPGLVFVVPAYTVLMLAAGHLPPN
jgi:hypothetical protein